MNGDFLDVLLATRAQLTETLARIDPDLDGDATELQRKVDEINETINRIVGGRFAEGIPAIRAASARLVVLNQELVVARERNEKIKSVLAIAAQVLQVVVGVAGVI